MCLSKLLYDIRIRINKNEKKLLSDFEKALSILKKDKNIYIKTNLDKFKKLT